MPNVSKSWLLPAFLFLCLPFNLHASWQLSTQQKENLSNSPHWQSLLHLRDDKPMITDSAFLLSHQNFTAVNELALSVKLYNQSADAFACQFPARFAWLRAQQQIETNKQDFSHCHDLSEYLNMVPFEQLSVVYASEVLSSASSMMGHVFLKASGQNVRNTEVAHAVSFFTEFNTANPFSIIYDSLFAGMSGFFIVRPYEKEYSRYVSTENRNLFEYSLDLNAQERFLVQLHIWELKDIDIQYLFQSYNCATLTLYVLGVGKPEFKQAEALFVSPADVVKATAQHNSITESHVSVADEWAINALLNQLGPERISDLLTMAADATHAEAFSNNALTPLELEFLLRVSRQDYGKEHFTANAIEELSDQQHTGHIFSLDRTVTKNPVDSSQDSIFSTEWLHRHQQNLLRLGFLPASHYQRTVDSQFFSDSALHIGETGITIDPDSLTVSLERFALYDVTAYTPSTELLPRLSGHLFIGYEQERDESLNSEGFLQIQGALGRSTRLHRDVLAYALGEVSMGLRLSQRHLSASSITGIAINTAFDGKARLEHRIKLNNRDDSLQHQSVLELSTQMGRDISLYARTEYWRNGYGSEKELRVGVDIHF